LFKRKRSDDHLALKIPAPLEEQEFQDENDAFNIR
jgi:hypothetical protein